MWFLLQTAVLIETLLELGAEVTWSSCNIFSTQVNFWNYAVILRISVTDDTQFIMQSHTLGPCCRCYGSQGRPSLCLEGRN